MIFTKRVRICGFFLVLFSLLFLYDSGISHSKTTRTIRFAQQEWSVSDSEWSKTSPGNNYFSDHEQNVTVDKDGKLHLTVRYDVNLGAWTCAQIVSVENARYGTYSYVIDSNLERFDQNLVLGIFFYKYDPDYPEERAEIDLEFSKWGFPKQSESGEWLDIGSNAWYVLWPSWKDGNTPVPDVTEGFLLQMLDYEKTLHEIQWENYYLSFRSYVYDPILHKLCDIKRQYPYYQAEYFQNSFEESDFYIPLEEDKMKIMINLWIIEGASEPFQGEEVEITLRMEYMEPGR